MASLRTPTKSNEKNLRIQLLRLYSIILVLAAHASVAMPSEQGGRYWENLIPIAHPQVGVDLFFVISGYLIGKSLISSAPLGGDRFLYLSWIFNYYVRRFWRLYPSSVFWITLTLVCGLIFQKRGLWLPPQELWRHWLASVMLVRNFAESLKPTNIAYFWSLSAEWQFYLFLPVFWALAPRRWVWKVVVLYVIISMFYRPSGDNWWQFRYDGMAWGLLLYEAERRGYVKTLFSVVARKGKHPWLELALVAAMVEVPVALAPILPTSGDPFPVFMSGPYHNLAWTLVDLIACLLLALTLPAAQPSPTTAPIWRWIDVGGEWSYSIYLCHIPVWLLVKELSLQWGLHTSGLTNVAVGLPIIIGAAALTYKFIETPLRVQRETPPLPSYPDTQDQPGHG